MPDLLPSARPHVRAVAAHEWAVAALDRPRFDPPPREASAWLTDYAAFLREQQDSYCQGG